MITTLPKTHMQSACEGVRTFVEMRPFDPLVWDRFLAGQDRSSWLQSTQYNEYKREFRWEDPVYMQSCDESGNVLGQAVALWTHPYEWGLYRRGLTALSPLAKRMLPVLLCTQAPTVFTEKYTTEMCRALGEWVATSGRARGCIYARMVPAYYQDGYVDHRGEVSEALQEMGFTASPKATLVIDLEQDVDVLFANLKRQARNKVRKAEKQGVEIVEVGTDDASLAKLQQVMAETSRRNGVPALSLEELKDSSWRRHYPLGFSRAFVSLHEGNLVSSQMATVFNGIILLGGVSYTDYSRQNNIYGNDLMQWYLIKWGKENGMQLLDFAGIAPQASSPKLRAICDFKSKWGGRRLDYDEFTMDFANAKSRVHRFLANAVGSQIKGWDRRWRSHWRRHVWSDGKRNYEDSQRKLQQIV